MTTTRARATAFLKPAGKTPLPYSEQALAGAVVGIAKTTTLTSADAVGFFGGGGEISPARKRTTLPTPAGKSKDALAYVIEASRYANEFLF